MAFQFKQFHIDDDRCAMKVGTDGVLLGAWTNVNHAKRILDIGTGSGLIALMLAQRTSDDILIDAVEIGEEDMLQAKANVEKSVWSKRITVHRSAIQNFQSHHLYDLIVSNPPYFINSLVPPSDKRATARHTPSLTFEELITAVLRLLTPDGRFAVVLPVKEGNDFVAKAQFKGLYCQKQLAFYARIEKPQERWLFEFSRTSSLVLNNEKLTLYEGAEWSEAYKKLISDFYLHVS